MSARALRTLLIFAREPNPLSAKTRLAPMFDGAQRVALYTAFLRDVADASRDADCDRRVVLWSPEEEPALLNDIFEGHELASQRGPDLGSRISHAFGDAFVAPGASSVVLIGSDAPLLGGEGPKQRQWQQPARVGTARKEGNFHRPKCPIMPKRWDWEKSKSPIPQPVCIRTVARAIKTRSILTIKLDSTSFAANNCFAAGGRDKLQQESSRGKSRHAD